MKTTSTWEIQGFGKRWLAPVFIVLWASACQSDSSPQPKVAQETHPLVISKKDFAGSGINMLNAQGMAPLHEAIKSNRIEKARWLIEHGADVHLYSASQMNPMYYAADCNRLEILKLLLAAGADIEAKSVREWGPLLIAAERGHTRIVAELIRHGADLRATGQMGWTALHSAAENGHVEVLKLLIEKGANVNTRLFPDTVLHRTAIKGHAEAAALLIRHGALIDQPNVSGAMPLHLAISYSHKDVINVLLENGGDPNVVASNGFTPLITAYKWPGVQHREDIALLLRLYGAE